VHEKPKTDHHTWIFFQNPLLRYFALWMLFGLLVFYLLVEWAAGSEHTLSEASGGLIIQLLAFLPFIWLFWKHTGGQVDLRYFFNHRIAPFSWHQLLAIWLIVLIFSFGLEGLIAYLVYRFAPDHQIWIVDQPFFPDDQHFLLDTGNFLLAVVIAPVMEELVFRGLLLQRLMIKYKPATAILVSSIIFGLLHVEAWPSASVFGIIMCLLFIHTRNLWVPVMIHIANNVVAVLINVVQYSNPASLQQGMSSQLWYYLLALLLTPLIVYFIKRYWIREDPGLPYHLNLSDAA
jgi:uncharacterized protein